MGRFDDLPRVSDELDPAQRLRVACELSDAAVELVRSRFRRNNPDADAVAIEAMVDRWLTTRPGATDGDAQGRPVGWPRGNER